MGYAVGFDWSVDTDAWIYVGAGAREGVSDQRTARGAYKRTRGEARGVWQERK
jgi:hypothetical protein